MKCVRFTALFSNRFVVWKFFFPVEWMMDRKKYVEKMDDSVAGVGKKILVPEAKGLSKIKS